jgi:serine/threonine protein kinase
MSPEQARGEAVDGRTDIFSLGILLFEGITGHNPLNKGSIVSTLSTTISDEPIDLSPLVGKTPPAVINLVEQAVAKNRQERYPTCEVLVADLDRCLDSPASASIILPPPAGTSPTGPAIHPAGKIHLTPEIEAVLQAMFGNFGWVEVETEFGSGQGGCRVFRVRPVEAGGKVHLPSVIKVGPTGLILQEWQAYQTWVEDTLPEIARLEAAPALPPGSQWGGLRYALVGGGAFPAQSLREYARQAGVSDLTWVLKNRLFKIMGDHWWRVHQTARLQLQAEYDALLPVNLLIHPTDTLIEEAYLIEPGNLPPLTPGYETSEVFPNSESRLPLPRLAAGKQVHLRGFVITEVDIARKEVTLNLPPAPPGQPVSSYRLRLMAVPDINRYQVGHVVDSFYGVIEATRHELLIAQVRRALGEAVDPPAERLTLPGGLGPRREFLPNPLWVYPAILNSFLTLHTSTIHGDLNLDNVLVDPETRQPTLIDFAAARRGHVLHDLLRLEAAIVTKLIPAALAAAGLGPETVYPLYRQLHHASSYPHKVASLQPPHPGLEKPWAMLVAIREMARECLFNATDWIEYYYGLSLYLLGTLKFKNLDELSKQVAFWSAATVIDLPKVLDTDMLMLTTRQYILPKRKSSLRDFRRWLQGE